MATLAEFGRVGANDWPLRNSFPFKLYGPVVYLGYWHEHNPGKAPIFKTANAARKALEKLYRLHGSEVIPT